MTKHQKPAVMVFKGLDTEGKAKTEPFPIGNPVAKSGNVLGMDDPRLSTMLAEAFENAVRQAVASHDK